MDSVDYELIGRPWKQSPERGFRHARVALTLAPAAAEAPAAGEAGSPPVVVAPPSAGEDAAGIDIEQMVNDELSTRAERLRRDFEAERERLEEELAKTRAATPPPPPDDEETEGGGG